MRYRLRTLLIAVAALAGCIQDVEQPAAPLMASPVPAETVERQVVALEWTDLAFSVQDRARFTVSELPERIRRLEGQ